MKFINGSYKTPTAFVMYNCSSAIFLAGLMRTGMHLKQKYHLIVCTLPLEKGYRKICGGINHLKMCSDKTIEEPNVCVKSTGEASPADTLKSFGLPFQMWSMASIPMRLPMCFITQFYRGGKVAVEKPVTFALLSEAK